MPDAYAHLAALDILAGGGTTTATPGLYAYRNQWRYNRSDAIGGVISSRPVKSLYAERVGAAVRGGIRIVRVGGACGEGTGTLEAINTTTLKWTAPGETTGVEIAVAYGETRILPSGTGGFKWIQIYRALTEELWGQEIIRIAAVSNNDVAGTVHLVEPNPWADTYIYRTVFLKNNSAYAVTNLAITPYDAGTYVRASTPSGDLGESVVDQDTAPVGGNPFSASLSGMSLAVGESVQIFLRHKSAFVDDGSGGPDISMCTTRWLVGAQVSYSANGVNTIRDDLCGVNQRGIASLAQYELWLQLNAWPTVGTGSPTDTASTPDGLSVDLGAGHTGTDVAYWWIRHRDQFGQFEALSAAPYSTTLSGADVVPSAPDDPNQVSVTSDGLGVMRVRATYDPQFDASETPASDFLIYATTDGSDPDPAIDTPTVVAIGWDVTGDIQDYGQARLNWTSAALTDETVYKVIVRMRRTLDGVTLDSDGVDIYTATAEWYPAQVRGPEAGESSGYGCQTGPDDIGESQVFDVTNQVQAISTDHGTELWANGDCVWSLRPDQWRHSYATSIATITGAASTTDAIEIGTWDGGAKEVFINVNGQHVALIECVSKTIQFAQYVTMGTPHDRNASTPVWQCYAHTCFQAFNGSSGRWETPMSVDSSGVLTLDVPMVACSQGDCLS